MAGGVNVKMGVSGVAQFKQSMNQAKQATKTLDAQLALTEKQFKASGDAESYMAEKTELLKAKMEQQESIVRNAEQALENMVSNGVERSSTAYQNLYREMLTAKGALVDTRTELQNVGTAGEDAATGVQDANAQLAQIGQEISFQNVTEGLGSITSGLGNIIKKAWEAGEALVRATLGAGAWADELEETATKYSVSGWEITPEELQRMRKTSQLIDTDVESIIASRDKLLKGMGGEDVDVFNFLHEKNIPTQGRNVQDVFWDVGEAIMGMSDDAEKQNIAMKVLGKSWAELKPLFTAGREEYEKTNDSWSVLNQQQIDNLTKMDDAYQKMNAEWETFKLQLLETFSGPLTEGMETISGLFKEFNTYLQSEEGKEKLAQIGDTISGLIDGLTSIDPAEVVSGLQGVIDKISGGLKWIKDNKDKVIGAVKGILAGWAALKVTGGVLDIMKIVNGLTGVSGATAASAGATAGASWAGAFATAAMKAAPFLAFLYTLLNPAGSANNDLDTLFDENGNPTQAARDAGITVTRDELDQSGYYNPEWRQQEEAQALEDRLGTTFTGDTEDAVSRNQARLNAGRMFEEGTVNFSGSQTMSTTAITSAIRNGLIGMKVVMSEETVGRLVAPTVNETIAGYIQ